MKPHLPNVVVYVLASAGGCGTGLNWWMRYNKRYVIFIHQHPHHHSTFYLLL